MQNLPKAKGSQELKVVEELKISKQIQANLSKFNPERSEIIENYTRKLMLPTWLLAAGDEGVRSRYQQDRQAVQNVKHSVGSNDRSKMIQDDPRRGRQDLTPATAERIQRICRNSIYIKNLSEE